MEVFATRRKEKDIKYVLGRNIFLSVFCFILSGIWFSMLEKDSLVLSVLSGCLFLLLGVVLIFFGVRNYMFNVRVNALPEDAIYKHYGKLVILNEKETTINIKEIKKVTSRRYIKTSVGLIQYISNEGVLNIKTDAATFKLENIEKVKKVEKELKNLIVVESSKKIKKERLVKK